MCPRTPEEWDRIRSTSRAHIVQSASEVFAERGFHASSMALIAERARVSKGLPYNYFSSKEELLAAVMDHWLEELETLWNGVAAVRPPAKKLERLLDDFCDSVDRNPDRYRLYLSVFLGLDYPSEVAAAVARSPTVRERVDRIRAASRTLFTELGAVDADAEVAFFSLLTSGIAAERVMSTSDYPMATMKARILACYPTGDPHRSG